MAQEHTILVVEDESDLRQILADIVSDLGYRVECACDGIEALEKVQKQEFVTCLCDINMPRLNGLDFAREVEKLGITLPLVALSGRSDRDNVTDALQSQLSGFVEKPFVRSDLVNALTGAVEGYLQKRAAHPTK